MPPVESEQLNRLLSALSKGDKNALDGILSLLGKRMFALAYGFVKSRADAEDILSESFLKIAQGIRTYRQGTNGYGWIMRIVRNCSLDFLRKRKRRATEDLDSFFSLADERYSPDRRADALLFQDALARLTPIERRLIYYRYYLDFTVRETAQEMGLSKSGVSRMTEQAEQKLKKILGQI